MRLLPRPSALFRSLLHKPQVSHELDEELRFHIEAETEANIAKGLPKGEARRQALIAFGGLEGVKEACWEQHSIGTLETTLGDLRYAARGLFRNPVFTLTAIFTLALGIGANTALFGVVNALLIGPLPYRDAARLIYVSEFWPHEPQVPGPPSMDFAAWRARGRSFDALEAYGRGSSFNLTGIGAPERVDSTMVTASFLSLLGVKPTLGRNFNAEEDRPNGTTCGHPLDAKLSLLRASPGARHINLRAT